MSEHALLSPPTGNFFRLLNDQHGLMVEIRDRPIRVFSIADADVLPFIFMLKCHTNNKWMHNISKFNIIY